MPAKITQYRSHYLNTLFGHDFLNFNLQAKIPGTWLTQITMCIEKYKTKRSYAEINITYPGLPTQNRIHLNKATDGFTQTFLGEWQAEPGNLYFLTLESNPIIGNISIKDIVVTEILLKEAITTCSCEIVVLMNKGCQCGGE